MAAIVSSQGSLLIDGVQRLSPSAVQQYWTDSKYRLDRWAHSLKSFANDPAAGDAEARRAVWPLVRGVLEEILVSEMLTRVWTAVLCGCDRRRGSLETEPIARSVLIGHLEARHRVLTFLVRGPNVDLAAVVRLNQLRRRVERWTDVLLGRLAGECDFGEFAFDAERAGDFGRDLQFQSRRPGGRHVWAMTLVSLRTAFCRCLAPVSPNGDLNSRIAASVLACFPAEVFDSTGQFRSVWLQRLCNTASDAQGMIAELLAPTPGRRMLEEGGRMKRME